ncbi:NAP1-related protein 1-like [Pyrus x bretschneideri]|uniref:NAP1-related protein 1-like n=1 Tax=Pyrus x bretschneideri TaxID=225117 RepID=UPI00202F4253|nr:NAP1-related protein 1-like [Pyrus x bretschneideri]
MVADAAKMAKLTERAPEDDAYHLVKEFVLSIEKLQEVQDELDKNFNDNPYFEDTKLTKTFTFVDGETTRITGTPIKWKEGMGLVNGVTEEKNGKKRPLVDESFFSLFDSPLEHDKVVEIIKNDLWPNPLKYFNNEADEEDSEDDEMDNGDEEEDDDEEDG